MVQKIDSVKGIGLALLLIFVCVQCSTMAMDEKIAELSSEDRAVREQAVRDLPSGGTGVIPPLVKVMAGDDHTAAAGARLALERLIHRASEPDQKWARPEVTRVLMAEAAKPYPKTVRCFLLRGVSYTGDGACVRGLVRMIHKDSEVAEMALYALSRIQGEAALRALRAAVTSAPPELRGGLVYAVASRGDRDAISTVILLTRHENPDLRRAALDSLARIPDKRGAEILWREGSKGSAPDMAAYAELADTLMKNGNKQEAVDMYENLFKKAPDVQDRCAGLAGLVKIKGGEALPLLVMTVGDPEPQLAGMAVDTLAHRSGEKVTLAMADAVKGSKGDIRVHLILALGHRRDSAAEDATETVIKTMNEAPPEEKVLILGALAVREDPALKDKFLDATGDDSEEVVVAALEALGRLQDPSTTQPIFEIAGQGSSREKAEALKAAVLIGDGVAAGDQAGALEIYRKALDLAEGDREKTLALDRIGKLCNLEGVALIQPYLDGENQGLQKAAARALAPLAMQCADEGSKEEAEGLLKAVVNQSDDAGLVADAAQKLREIGVEVEVPVREGFLRNFWIIGPFPGRDDMMKANVVPVDEAVDLDAPVGLGTETYQWKYHRLEHIEGMVDLLKVVAQSDDVGAFVYAEVTADKDMDVTFRIGSDDDVYCWLNYEQVHAFEGGRGWGADQDKVDVKLKAGVNTILFKVLNGGGGWAVSLKITDRDGNPLTFTEKTEN